MRIRLFLLLLFLLAPLQAYGHKIHVFAWVSGDTVTVESRLSGNNPLVRGKVTVQDTQTARIILQGTGDAKGIFSFTIPQEVRERAADILISVSGGAGHQAEWLLAATEYVSEKSVAAVSSPHTTPNAELKQMLEELLAKELAPIRRSLARAEEKKPDFQDIMGGIGYLIGLAGLAAWLRNRNHENKHKS